MGRNRGQQQCVDTSMQREACTRYATFNPTAPGATFRCTSGSPFFFNYTRGASTVFADTVFASVADSNSCLELLPQPPPSRPSYLLAYLPHLDRTRCWRKQLTPRNVSTRAWKPLALRVSIGAWWDPACQRCPRSRAIT